jgi:PhzF family phenazine biosynthesis protein
MPQPIVVVDAFSARPFAGNPAAVCILERPADERWMQLVAREMNLSETAFLHAEGERYRLRWFTPQLEVDLCGHATLAASHVLWEEGHLPPDRPARFITKSGELSATRVGDLAGGSAGDWIELDFPAATVEPLESVPEEIVRALGARPRFLGRTRWYLLAELESEQVVRELAPDTAALARLGEPAWAVIVTAGPAAEHDFVSRFFAPGVGIDEDPVTGAAHCALGPYWRERLGKDRLRCFQASPRGGELRLRVGEQRVRIAGQAVTVLRGQLLV